MYSGTASRTDGVSVRALITIVSSCLLALAGAGCLPQQDGSGSSFLPELVLAAPAPRPPAAQTFNEAEPNDDYNSAQPITVDSTTDVIGTIRANAIDRDIYDLGPVNAGDRVEAELTINANADIVLGVLDDRGTLIGMVDLSSTSAGPRKMDLYLHEASSRLFAVVTTRTTAASDRGYTAHLTLQRGVGVPSDRSQVVVLNFQGASGVRIGGRPGVDVPPFDAAALSPRFAGQTDAIIQNIVYMTAQAYEGLGVQLFVAGDPAIPDAPRSTVYYGTYDSQLLGLADNVDPYNVNTEQSAILYTDTFSLFDALSPDIEAMSQVLANTTCHEIGHLLGLRHTSDVHDIMDTTATARQMMVRQSFRTSTVNPTVMNFGLQDAQNLLAWAVGGALTGEPNGKQLAARLKAIETASRGIDFYIPRDLLIGGHSDGEEQPNAPDPQGMP